LKKCCFAVLFFVKANKINTSKLYSIFYFAVFLLLSCINDIKTKIVSGSNRSNNSPSIDRFDNSKGYVKGNVWIISDRANRLKSNLSKEDLYTFCTEMLRKLT
jgi:hypothetical protein